MKNLVLEGKDWVYRSAATPVEEKGINGRTFERCIKVELDYSTKAVKK